MRPELLQIGEPYGDARAHLAGRFRHFELSLDRLEQMRAGELAEAALLDRQLVALGDEIASRERATDGRRSLPLCLLADSLGLDRDSVELLVALAAPELEPRLLARCARLWPEGRHGDLAFYRDLIGRESHADEVVRALSVGGALARHGLVHLTADRAWNGPTPRLFQRVRLGARVSPYLSGELLPTAHTLSPSITVRARGRALHQLVVTPEVVERLRATVRAASHSEGRSVVCLLGPRHVGRKTLVQAVLQRPLVILDCGRFSSDLGETLGLVREALCETALQGGAFYLDHADALVGESKLALRQALGEQLSGLSVPLFAGLEGPPSGLLDAMPDLRLSTIPSPDSFQQTRMWSLLLPEAMQLESGRGVEWLAAHYSLPAGAIARSVDEMVRETELRGATRITHEDSVAAVRRQLGGRFGDLAELVVNSFAWSDLVLPDDTMQRVLEIVSYHRNRDRLLREWGFEAKLPYGRSLSVLLLGDPGTGKTMVAGLLAKEMGLELFRVNISKIVDKYIGETEKNLGRIFEEAKRGQVALLFDEADSLFGKRTEVRSSTDRYSNLAINFLLQSVESHDGVIFLTTNHEKAMDPAFKRRLRFRVRFPFPELAERAALWKSMIPPQARIDSDIRWESLAKDFDLAGGSIKNAVVRAALHAIAGGTAMSEELLRHAGRLESEEMGRLVKAARQPSADDELGG